MDIAAVPDMFFATVLQWVLLDGSVKPNGKPLVSCLVSHFHPAMVCNGDGQVGNNLALHISTYCNYFNVHEPVF